MTHWPFALWLAAQPVEVLPPPPWIAEADPTAGVVRVLPVVTLCDPPSVDLAESLIGLSVPWGREAGRRARTEQLAQIPREFGIALPGEVQVALGHGWEGRFTVGRWPMGGRDHLASALRGHGDLDTVLSDLGDDAGPILVTWVEALDGHPITAEALPGEVVETASGPVVSDLDDEPYRVTARVGTALVAGDEVVVRYTDDFETVLSGSRGPDRVARDLARDLAAEIAILWPTDPRLVSGSDTLEVASGTR